MIARIHCRYTIIWLAPSDNRKQADVLDCIVESLGKLFVNCFSRQDSHVTVKVKLSLCLTKHHTMKM